VTRTADGFARGVIDGYRSRLSESASLSKSVRASAVGGSLNRPMGHPAFAGLDLDESGHCEGAVVFIDLRDFTGRTFWDTPEQTVALALAVITQVVEIVYDHGGYVLGLRGDGVMACFGESGSDPSIDVAMALAASAFALDATENALNNMLRLDGIAPVQLRAGADHGRLDFVRQGTEDANEVNVIGFAAYIKEPSLRVLHADSPKRYQRNYQERTYQFYDVRWRSLVPHLDGIAAELGGASTSHVRIY
jgi:adenylate cyclase